METLQKAILLLEDGTSFTGESFGAEGEAIGEAVFSTSMVGYQQALTDPANHGLLLVQTFPLIGNYGVNSDDYASLKAHAAGYIVREYCTLPSNYKCEGTIRDFLCRQGVVAICGLDTRALTRYLRDHGSMRGMITTAVDEPRESLLARLRAHVPDNAVKAVSSCIGGKAGKVGNPAEYHVAVLDFGTSRSLGEALLAQDAEVTYLPWNASAEQVKALSPDGIVLSDGPGDPRENPEIIANVKEMLSLGIPMLGISLGHQILALANGMEISKLKNGHRGANQPVKCIADGRTYITSQNHGYVVSRTDDAICSVTYENANDHTVEGIAYRDIPAMSVQFLPDGVEYSQSTKQVYDAFFAMMKGKVE